MTLLRPTLQSTPSRSIRNTHFERNTIRFVPEEVPVAISYAGSSHAVLMATPDDLVDFAIGFSLTEGIVQNASQIRSLDVVEGELGIDVQVFLADDVSDRLRARKRSMAGPVGCGLCGIESIDQAMRTLPDLSAVELRMSHASIVAATAELARAQDLHRQTRAVHAAGLYVEGSGLVGAREDVGRHNALDKLCGFVFRSSVAAEKGAVVVTSRISVEMVQKTAMLSCAMLIAVSAPTALAIRTAEAAGITLIALARGEDFEIFSNPHRVGP
ncbi:formate dehydrogenase accessory sulfurtransferase FdhD [Rhizobium sp. SG570]|uniref:formate dehydrogenase accessory sulfurtransferase FdhD n=1 Tax=Rhizobium sp. SG570 TaxID=2587113 RepID=UPI001445D19E|nr:formate dehydrogenase accessory sulfurtransferase FdhD [Rhizobium sp. SG570]NKJ36478.1 FdhD protein [Rhizobium sp. SG570]